jgi:hypothetical protein
MLRILRTVLLVTILGVALPHRASAQKVFTCGAATGTTAETMLSGVRRLVSGSSKTDSLWRVHAKLPKTAAANVTFVTADSLCDAAARAVAALSTPAAPIARVWVIAVGPTRYVVFGAPRVNSQAALSAVFDTTLSWLADY